MDEEHLLGLHAFAIMLVVVEVVVVAAAVFGVVREVDASAVEAIAREPLVQAVVTRVDLSWFSATGPVEE